MRQLKTYRSLDGKRHRIEFMNSNHLRGAICERIRVNYIANLKSFLRYNHAWSEDDFQAQIAFDPMTCDRTYESLKIQFDLVCNKDDAQAVVDTLDECHALLSAFTYKMYLAARRHDIALEEGRIQVLQARNKVARKKLVAAKRK